MYQYNRPTQGNKQTLTGTQPKILVLQILHQVRTFNKDSYTLQFTLNIKLFLHIYTLVEKTKKIHINGTFEKKPNPSPADQAGKSNSAYGEEGLQIFIIRDRTLLLYKAV